MKVDKITYDEYDHENRQVILNNDSNLPLCIYSKTWIDASRTTYHRSNSNIGEKQTQTIY